METPERDLEQHGAVCPNTYPSMEVNLRSLKMFISAGSFGETDIIALTGKNSSGKAAFLRMLAGTLEPGACSTEVPTFNVSFKPEVNRFDDQSIVRDLLKEITGDAYTDPLFEAEVMKPLNIAAIINREMESLSADEIQKVAIVLCLGKPADVYLIHSISDHLDFGNRRIMADVIKRFIMNRKKTAFVADNDATVLMILANRVIELEDGPSGECYAKPPQAIDPDKIRSSELLDHNIELVWFLLGNS